MVLSNQYKKSLKSILCKFKWNDLRLLIKNVVFDKAFLTAVERDIKKYKFSNIKEYADAIISLFEIQCPSVDVCDNVLSTLQLCDASLHSSHKWAGVRLISFDGERPSDADELKKMILQKYRSMSLNVYVNIIFIPDIIWTVVREKVFLKKGGTRLGPPSYFAFKQVSEVISCLFFSPPSIKGQLPLQNFIEVMGFNDYESLNVTATGENVADLINSVENDEPVEIPEYIPFSQALLSRSENIDDFTEAEARAKYADIVINNSSKSKIYIVEGEGCLKGSKNDSLNGVNIKSKLTFKSRGKCKTANDLIKYLITENTFKLPLPSYVKHLGVKSHIVRTSDC